MPGSGQSYKKEIKCGGRDCKDKVIPDPAMAANHFLNFQLLCIPKTKGNNPDQCKEKIL